jgi:hypothetical protein
VLTLHPDPRAGLAITYDAIGEHELAERAWQDSAGRDIKGAYADPQKLVRSLRWRPDQAEKLQRIIDRAKRKNTSARINHGPK